MKIFKVLVVLAILSLMGVSSAVFAKDQVDRGPLTKITFIHYKKDKNQAKPGGSPKPSPSICYGYLAKGAKWKTTEDFFVNPTGSTADPTTVLPAINAGVAAWETAAHTEIFTNGILDGSATYNDGNFIGQNTASFGTYSDPNVIAVTTVWGYLSAPPPMRELVEWHMLFNTDFTWGTFEANPAAMDLQNIATHELGHSAGMDDLYTTSCTLETMYGYSTEGETSKRDLYNGDIKGIQALYL